MQVFLYLVLVYPVLLLHVLGPVPVLPQPPNLYTSFLAKTQPSSCMHACTAPFPLSSFCSHTWSIANLLGSTGMHQKPQPCCHHSPTPPPHFSATACYLFSSSSAFYPDQHLNHHRPQLTVRQTPNLYTVRPLLLLRLLPLPCPASPRPTEKEHQTNH